MKIERISGIFSVLVFFLITTVLVTSCSLPLIESEIPEEEWVVTEVQYNPAHGDIIITFGEGMGFHQADTYYEGFTGKVFIDWKKRIVFPEGFSVSSIDDWYNGITATDDAKPVLSSGALVHFSDAWFYEVDTETSVLTSNYRAKIRIVTRSFPITIITDIPVL